MTREDIDSLLDDAYTALLQEDAAGARRHLDSLRKVAADEPEVLILEMEILEAEGADEEAVAAAEEARARFPKDMLIGFHFSTLMLDMFDDVTEARPVLEALLARLDKGEKPGLTAKAHDLQDDERDPDDEFRLGVALELSYCRLQEEDPQGALVLAEKAVKIAPDDADPRLARARALFDLCELDDAKKAIAQAIDRNPQQGECYWFRGRLLTAMGDEEGAQRAFDRAVALDPERFTAPFRMTEDAFVAKMEEALAELPDSIRDYLKNVAIMVEDIPDVAALKSETPVLSPSLLGLHRGLPPALDSVENKAPTLPNEILLFRKNIEIAAQDEGDLIDLIGSTLIHEIGHYLGLDEEDLIERGLE